jgi:hypothetical protein
LDARQYLPGVQGMETIREKEVKSLKIISKCSDCPNAQLFCDRGPKGSNGGGDYYPSDRYPKTQDWRVGCTKAKIEIASFKRVPAKTPSYQADTEVLALLSDVPIPEWCPLPDVDVK